MHIVYEDTYFSVFIMISFVADAYDSRTYLEYVLCFYEQQLDKPVLEGISFHFLATLDQQECKQLLQNKYFCNFIANI